MKRVSIVFWCSQQPRHSSFSSDEMMKSSMAFFSAILCFLLLLNDGRAKPSLGANSDSTVLAASRRTTRQIVNNKEQLEELKNRRIFVEHDLIQIQRALYDTVESYGDDDYDGTEPDIRKLIKELDAHWLELGKLNLEIRPYIVELGGEELEVEIEHQRQLMDDRADILYKAKARRCKSRKETFFKPEDKCFPFQDLSNNPCPDKQILMDDLQTNEGYCDCQEGQALVYFLQANECYKLNTQGPCDDGHWVVVRNGSSAPSCEKVPKDCPNDGLHVYMSDDCFELGTRAFCPEDKLLSREPNDPAQVECSTADSGSKGAPSFGDIAGLPQSAPSCPSGSLRDQNGSCKRQFGRK